MSVFHCHQSLCWANCLFFLKGIVMPGIAIPEALLDRLERLSALTGESVEDLVIDAVVARLVDLEDAFHEGGLPDERLRERLFERAGRVLHHYWIDQKNSNDGAARISTRIFDHLFHHSQLLYGSSGDGATYKEHLVPCALVRDQAFKMFFAGKGPEDVAAMLERTLKIAMITREEAYKLDHGLKLKTRMPEGWCFDTGPVTARLDEAGIKLNFT
jgi:hypothetical protein